VSCLQIGFTIAPGSVHNPASTPARRLDNQAGRGSTSASPAYERVRPPCPEVSDLQPLCQRVASSPPLAAIPRHGDQGRRGRGSSCIPAISPPMLPTSRSSPCGRRDGNKVCRRLSSRGAQAFPAAAFWFRPATANCCLGPAKRLPPGGPDYPDERCLYKVTLRPLSGRPPPPGCFIEAPPMLAAQFLQQRRPFFLGKPAHPRVYWRFAQMPREAARRYGCPARSIFFDHS